MTKGRSGFFASAATPWDEPSDFAVWVVGAAVGGLIAHNLMRAWKGRHR